MTSNGSMRGTHPAPPPLMAQFARAITFCQAGSALCVLCIYMLALLSPDMRPLGWLDLWLVVGVLGFMALAVTSAARLGTRGRWAWWGAMVTNVVTALIWMAAIIYIAIETAQTTGTDPGMVLVAVTFIGVPMIVISGAALVFLVLPPVWRYYLAADSSHERAGTFAPGGP
jgi:hypothetical protein